LACVSDHFIHSPLR